MAFDTGWMAANTGPFRRIVSRSRKWFRNGESMKGCWPSPSVRKGCVPFGPIQRYKPMKSSENYCHAPNVRGRFFQEIQKI